MPRQILDSDARLSLLRGTMFFSDSPEPLLRALADRCRERELAEGEILCRAGDPGDALYIVQTGLLEIYLGEAPLDEAGPGECLGEMALVTEASRSASIRALQPTRLLVLDKESFSDALDRHPRLAWGIFRELAAKVRSSIGVRVRQHQLNQQLEEAFARSVSRSVMEEILRSGDPVELLEGSTKKATVLFADVRSFTSLSETMDPTTVIHLLNEYLSSMVDVILDVGGTLDKFLGDGILAHFGVPLTGDDDPGRAVACAQAMHRRLGELRNSGRWMRATPLEIGIGLASGRVVAGCIGSERRMEYTAIGDVVNLASRIEGLTKPYRTGILMDGVTAEAVEGNRMVDRVRVKGKRQATELHDVPPAGADGLMDGYAEAYQRYLARDFATAADRFVRLAETHDDGPSAVLADRCRHFATSPPDDDWDGINTLETK